MGSTTVKASVRLGDQVITFEGPKEFVEVQVARYVEQNGATQKGQSQERRAQQESVAAVGERQLIEAKKPRRHEEVVAVLAFCLTESGTREFDENDIRRAYVRAGVRPPKVVGQALRDAKNNFDYIEPGAKRGTYRLTSHGARTVRLDLPRRDRQALSSGGQA